MVLKTNHLPAKREQGKTIKSEIENTEKLVSQNSRANISIYSNIRLRPQKLLTNQKGVDNVFEKVFTKPWAAPSLFEPIPMQPL